MKSKGKKQILSSKVHDGEDISFKANNKSAMERKIKISETVIQLREIRKANKLRRYLRMNKDTLMNHRGKNTVQELRAWRQEREERSSNHYDQN